MISLHSYIYLFESLSSVHPASRPSASRTHWLHAFRCSTHSIPMNNQIPWSIPTTLLLPKLFSRWLALVALTSSFCLLHSCWSLFTARFFPCVSDWTELLGTTARLTAFAAQPDTTASRTLLPLSIKLLYLALTAHCLLSCRLVRWTRACGFSTFSARSCDFWSLLLSAWINSTKRSKIP